MSMKIKGSPKIKECGWKSELSHHVEIRTAKFGFRQNWKFSEAFVIVIINKVLTGDLTKNTKIVHFTQNIDILRKDMGEGQFPVGKLVELFVSIWYNCDRRPSVDNSM